jgi:hypothetical protein
MDTVRGVCVSSSGSYVSFHEIASAVGDFPEKDGVDENKGKDSENVNANRDVENKDNVAKTGIQK